MNLISAHEASNLLTRRDILLIDVREPAEHTRVHIAIACLAPLSRLKSYTIPDGISQVVVHCKSGVRAKSAIDQLQSRFPNVVFHNMDKGIEGWQQAGLAVRRGQGKGIPLDRQVQLVVGIAVLLGLTLGWFIHPAWLGLSAVVATIVIFSGITGQNPFTVLVARMPWNQP